MPYIGNTPAEKYAAFDVQYFTTSATTSYTLDHAVANELDIRLVINNVIQEPGSGKAYTASGTTLTLSAATAGTDTMYCVYTGKASQTVNPPAGSVGINQLSATGTKDATTFLRGDNTFATAGITGITSSADATAMTIDSGERVGINSSNMSSLDADANQLVVGSGSGDNGATIYSDGSSSGSIFFANGTSGTQTKQGQIVYEQNNSAMVFKTGATERQRIASNSIPAWHLIYSDDVSGMGSGTNAYTDSNMFSSTYNFYRIYILDWEPQSDGVNLEIQFKLGGVTRTADYKWNVTRETSNAGSPTSNYSNGDSDLRIWFGCGNGTGESMSGWFEYTNPTGDTGNWYTTQSMYTGVNDSGYATGGVGAGTNQNSTGPMTGFTIMANTGGLGNYKLRAYGLKQS